MALEAAAAVVVGRCANGGVSLRFKGELGKPIQIAYRGGGFLYSPGADPAAGFYLLVSRMKLCVSGRYCCNICIFDLDHRAGEAVSVRVCVNECVYVLICM